MSRLAKPHGHCPSTRKGVDSERSKTRPGGFSHREENGLKSREKTDNVWPVAGAGHRTCHKAGIPGWTCNCCMGEALAAQT